MRHPVRHSSGPRATEKEKALGATEKDGPQGVATFNSEDSYNTAGFCHVLPMLSAHV